MSQNPNNLSFPTPESLSDWLKLRLPTDSLSTWGTIPGTKNIHNLWLELEAGETTLTDTHPPIRQLQVVCARIKRHNNNHKNNTKLLVESCIELSDGCLINRGRPLSEKMKFQEDVESAVKRGIKEELGSVLCVGRKDVNFDEIVRVVSGSYVRRVEERDSSAYPGLPGSYVFHSVDVFVDGLPEGEFVTEEVGEYAGFDQGGVVSEAVLVKRHFWKWVDDGGSV